jgi:hypothetical protein
VSAAYHDNLRSDYEMFAASIEGADLQMTTKLMVSHTIPVYLLAYNVARAQDAPLLERTFLLRYQASLGFSDPRIGALGEDWERERLIAATIALLKDRIGVTAARRLVVEQGDMDLATIAAALGGGAVTPIAPARLAAFAAEPGDFVLAEYWSGLAGVSGGAGRIAVADVVASLRLPGSRRQPQLLGPAGTTHVVRDGAPPPG